MSKVLKRLYLGDVVKSFGTKQLRKLTTEKPQENGIVVSYILNETIDYPTMFYTVDIPFICNGVTYQLEDNSQFDQTMCFSSATNIQTGELSYKYLYYGKHISLDENRVIAYRWVSSGYALGWQDERYRILHFLKEPTGEFLDWLNANGKKQEEKPIDPYGLLGTWVFDDGLTTPSADLSMFTASTDIFSYVNAEGVEIKCTRLIVDRISTGKKQIKYDGSNGVYTVYDNYNESGWKHSNPKTVKIFNVKDLIGNDVQFTPNAEAFVGWLNANATKQESIVGTWVFNDTIIDIDGVSGNYYTLNFEMPYLDFDTGEVKSITVIDGELRYVRGALEGRTAYIHIDTPQYASTYYYEKDKGSSGNYPYILAQTWSNDTFKNNYIDKTSEVGIALRTIKILGGADVEDERVKTIIKANATKIA